MLYGGWSKEITFANSGCYVVPWGYPGKNQVLPSASTLCASDKAQRRSLSLCATSHGISHVVGQKDENDDTLLCASTKGNLELRVDVVTLFLTNPKN